MNCINHANIAAVGICKVCGRALCRDCLVETAGGIACKGRCEGALAVGAPAVMGMVAYRGIRKQSKATLFGWPLLSIAIGVDPEKGEIRGHARGVIAIGDMATGGFAFGGLARGLIAFGGLAVGVLAIGGCAVGAIALGGGAVGYVAIGGGAFGRYVFSGIRQSPELVEFLSRWIPALKQLP
jgi:hypothetical protein